MDVPKEISPAQLEVQKNNAKKILKLGLQIRTQHRAAVESGDSGITFAQLHSMFVKVVGNDEQSAAGNIRAINLVTPQMLGPTERALFSDIAAYGLAVLRAVNGVPPGANPESAGERLAMLFDREADLQDAYNELSNAVNTLVQDFPATPFERAAAAVR